MSENEQDSISNEISLEQKRQNKMLYVVGDITTSGNKIEFIYSQSLNYIIYSGQNDSLCWEVNNLDSNFVAGAVAEASRLMGLAHSCLSRRHITTINHLITNALCTAFLTPMQNSENIPILFKEVIDYIENYKDEIKSILHSDKDFAIYLSKNDNIQWFHKKLPNYLDKAVEEYSNLDSLSNSILPKFYKSKVLKMLASSLAVAFKKENQEEAQNAFDNTKKFILSQVDSYLRVSIFVFNSLATIIFSCFLFIVFRLLDLNIIFMIGMIAGVLGSMISTLQRNNEISIDPYSGLLGLYTECISRLTVGAVFGLFVIFCIKSELALANFKDNLYAIACFSFIAGFSERFVPDLMSSITKNNDIDNTKT